MRVKSLILVLIVAASIVAFGVGCSHDSTSRDRRSESQAAIKSPPARVTVSLTAQTHQTKAGRPTIQLHWNASAESIQHSSSGILYIYDGGIPSVRMLERAVLQAGSAEFAPVSDEITFHLVLDQDRTGGEFVLVLLGAKRGTAPTRNPTADVSVIQKRKEDGAAR
ncbi:MAG: hypothetical protein ACJ74Z_23595 [Bryobacteraceae bacterium]